MFSGPYIDWNQKRIKAFVEYYGHQFFFKKKVLDLGSGHGDISGVLHRLGSEVTAVDARQEHLKIISKKYPGVKVVKADLDQPWPFFGNVFDLTLDLALLCHLNKFEDHLKAVCACSSYLILETAVLDSNDPEACIVKPDNKNVYDGSFNGFSSQVSAANIERVLTKYGMRFQRMDNTKFNSGPYVYDWHSQNNNSFDINKRRIWFCIRQPNQSTTPLGEGNTAPNVLPAIHGGTFSPHLTDSKIPISHQKLITTASPAPPRQPQTPHALFAASLAAAPSTDKVRLFYHYYEDKNAHKKAELDFVLRKNIDNPFFNLIVIESESSPTFDFMFEKVNKLSGPNEINIICNSRIFFNNSISLVKHINHKEAYVLDCWDWSSDTNNHILERGQFAWIVRGKIENVLGNFPMDKPGCDGRIAYELQRAGYKIINPSKSIKACQIHNSKFMNDYTENDRVSGDYLYVPVTSL